MKYYAVIGRLYGRDEDSAAAYNPMPEEEAIRRFKFWLRKTYLSEKEAEQIARDEAAGADVHEHEQVYIAFTLSSDSPIDIETANV